jgi:ribosome-associated protein
MNVVVRSPMPSTAVQEMLAAAAAACEDKKAEDIRILALDPSESGLTDYFLICSGNSDRQNVAITDEIEIRLKREFGTYPTSVEGRRQGEWVLMDYVDFIVHVFSAEKRAYYGLERLRKTATVLSIDDLNAEIKSAIAASRSKNFAVRKTPAKKAPAKKAVSTRDAAKAASKSAAKKPAAKTRVAKKVPAKKAPAKKVPAKKAPASKAPVKAAKKPAAKKGAKKSSRKAS